MTVCKASQVCTHCDNSVCRNVLLSVQEGVIAKDSYVGDADAKMELAERSQGELGGDSDDLDQSVMLSEQDGT